MTDLPKTEREAWLGVREQFNVKDLKLGRIWSDNIHQDPKYLACVLSRYKFAARMVSNNKRILELGCNEGIGVPVLAEFSSSYLGVDRDAQAIKVASESWAGDKIKFIADNFLGKKYGQFDSVVSFDLHKQINPGEELRLLQTIYLNLGSDGVCLLGIAEAKRLIDATREFFYNIFIFNMNDEIIQAGFSPTADYHLVMGIYKKKKSIS